MIYIIGLHTSISTGVTEDRFLHHLAMHETLTEVELKKGGRRKKGGRKEEERRKDVYTDISNEVELVVPAMH